MRRTIQQFNVLPEARLPIEVSQLFKGHTRDRLSVPYPSLIRTLEAVRSLLSSSTLTISRVSGGTYSVARVLFSTAVLMYHNGRCGSTGKEILSKREAGCWLAHRLSGSFRCSRRVA